MAFTCYAPPVWARQLETREVLGAYFRGLTICTNELELPGASRSASNRPELSVYLDTKRGSRLAGDEAS